MDKETREALKGLDRRLDSHDAILKEHTAKLDEHTAKLDRLDARLDTMADEVAGEVIRAMGVMFESQRNDLKVLWEKINHQDSKIENHEGRIRRLESKKSA